MKIFSRSVLRSDSPSLLYNSIAPEIDSSVTDRARIDVEITEDSLVLEIEADDVISMRSTLNTWLRLIRISNDIYEISSELLSSEIIKH